MRKYLGLEHYDDIQQIATLNVEGFIIGDPFCPYRMFRYGDADMLDFAHIVCEMGKEIVYQTPVYVTDRNFMKTAKLIEYLHDRCDVRKFLVQDIGLTDWLVNHFSDIDAIWGHWGRNRNSLINHDFIEFLLKLGVSGIETNLRERIRKIPKAGLPVYAVYGELMYNTISRDCYNSYMLDRFDGLCGRECLNGDMSLHRNGFQMTVDGHILGRKIQYPKDKAFFEIAKHNIMIYAVNFQMAIGLIENIKDERYMGDGYGEKD